MTAPAPDEGLATLLARTLGEFYCNPEWSGERIIGDLDDEAQFRSAQGRWEAQEEERQAQIEAMEWALDQPQVRAVLAAAGPDSTGRQGESVVEWGVRKRQQWSSLGIDRVAVETSWTGHDGWTTGPYDEAECRRLSRSGGQYGEVVTRQRTRYPDTVTPWVPVEEPEHG